MASQNSYGGFEDTQHDAPIIYDTQISDEVLQYDSDEESVPLEHWGTLMSSDPTTQPVQLVNNSNETDESGRCNKVIIGRGINATVKYNSSPRISNKHCMLYCKMNNADPNYPCLEAFIEDYSANGTYINRETKLTKNFPRMLHNGEEISLVNPELSRVKNAGVTQKDIANNSFTIVLHIVTEKKGRDNIFKIGSNYNTMPEPRNNMITRSSTVMRLLDQNRNIFEFYELKDLLGTGTSGSVSRCIHKMSGVEWAVKIIDTRRLNLPNQEQGQGHHKHSNDSAIMEITKEAEMLRALRHPNIVHLEDIFAEGSKLYLVMELSTGGDLFDRILSKPNGHYSESDAKAVMKKVLDAMEYLHCNNVAHRDLKPENILLVSRNSDVDIKITDFGLAKKVDDKIGGLKSFCGTPHYFAPEVLERQNTTKGLGTYSLAADMWSIGVILYVILAGTFPFKEDVLTQNGGARARGPNELLEKAFQGDVWKGVSKDAQSLISSLLTVSPRERYTAQQALQSKWIRSMATSSSSSMPPPDTLSSALRHSASVDTQASDSTNNDKSTPMTSFESEISVDGCSNSSSSSSSSRSSTRRQIRLSSSSSAADMPPPLPMTGPNQPNQPTPPTSPLEDKRGIKRPARQLRQTPLTLVAAVPSSRANAGDGKKAKKAAKAPAKKSTKKAASSKAADSPAPAPNSKSFFSAVTKASGEETKSPRNAVSASKERTDSGDIAVPSPILSTSRDQRHRINNYFTRAKKG